MIRKYCPNCGEYSYSCDDRGEWLCPTCDADLTCVQSESAGR